MKLWKDYYNCSKPFCSTCLEKGITPDQYAFCSSAKKPFLIYEEDGFGRKGKLIGTFENIHACNVYDWTIYQGKSNRLKSE